MFAKIKDGVIVQWPIDNLRQNFQNTSFPEPLKDTDLPEGYVKIHYSNQPNVNVNQKIVAGVPVFQNNKWVQGWNVVEMTTEEFNEFKNAKAQDARVQRDNLLAASDWTQLSDVQIDKTPWILYRKALRDITKQIGFPLNIQWPISP